MHVLHAAPISTKTISGPRYSVPPLVVAQNALPDVWSGLLLTGVSQTFDESVDAPVYRYADVERSGSSLGLESAFRRPDLIVFHSTYIWSHMRLASWAADNQIPYLVVPRGGLTATAQESKRLKKAMANLLYFRRYIKRASAIQYLTRAEAAESTGWSSRTFVLGNGVKVPSQRFASRRGSQDGIDITFVGRLSWYMKGLDLVVDATKLAETELRRHSARVTLYGPSHEGGAEWLHQRISRLGVGDLVRIAGPVVGEAKQMAFIKSDLFLHPSRAEGHPSSVLEALSYEVPCILTPGTNLSQEVVAAKAGWQVEPTPTSVASGLVDALSRRSEFSSMGTHGRELVAREYDWKAIASRSIAHYRRILESR